MSHETPTRRQTRRLWVLPHRRRRNRGRSPWYPQAQTVIEAGPVVTLPQETAPSASSVFGTLVALLILMGGGRHRAVPAAMALGFGGPDLSAALFGESA